LIRYRAAWVLPISRSPVAGGVVTIDRGRIVDVGQAGGGSIEDLGDVAILPGLVNAHTHLELSWLRDRVPPSSSMAAWAAALIAERRESPSDPLEPVALAIREARDSGTSLVGDVSNTMASYGPLANSPLHAALFRELLGFSAPDPDAMVADASAKLAAFPSDGRLRTTLAPHAPYSVSPALLRAIARASEGRPLSIHLGESAEETQFLRDGSGAWRVLLESLGAWNASWTPPAAGPVEYLQRLGLVTPSLVAVHGVQLADAELETLAAAGATLVTCPRSNRWTGAGDPPIERFYRSGVRVAIGTDSLASVDDLDMFAELAAVRRLAPSLAARALLESATRHGADALGFGSELGTIDRGKAADLIAVRIPGDVRDVEEYLVDGIAAEDVTWIPTTTL
jgi:cytosine/adenosine deaminase-related metal-dependent hydrolase